MQRKCEEANNDETVISREMQKDHESPPPIPQYWVWSSLVFERPKTSPHQLCQELLKMFNNVGLECTQQDQWVWSLEGCYGVHYVMAECHVFTDDLIYKIDIQLLYGDRMTWWKRVRIPLTTGKVESVKEPNISRYTNSSSYVLLDQFPLEGLACMGQDARPSSIVPLLQSSEPNVVRCAMMILALCQAPPTDWSDINKWLAKRPKTYLDRETIRWAHRVYQKKSNI